MTVSDNERKPYYKRKTKDMRLFSLLAGDTTLGVVVVVALVVLIGAAYILAKIRSKPNYTAKEALLTETEIRYYDEISEIVGEKYFLFPQINLASIVDKKSDTNSRTDLFRNIDFGVFDYNFKPILLIEINDNSHIRKDRKERDEKVADILKKAKLPLVTFWVKDGIDPEGMRREISKYVRL